MIKFNKILKPVKDKIKETIFQTDFYLSYYLKQNNLTKIFKLPKSYPLCSILKTKQEYRNAIKEAKDIGLEPLYYLPRDIAKNWNSSVVLSIILRKTKKNARILDAGGEYYSVILPWLLLYGYRKLRCINLSFKTKSRRGPIIYEYGDLTNTKFKNNFFDIITCLSVIEHGVDLDSYFKETSRILKPGGILITSTDYWATKINTKNKRHFDVPVKIFSKKEILNMVDIAKKYNLKLLGNLELDCNEKTVRWLGLGYTFIYISLQKSI